MARIDHYLATAIWTETVMLSEDDCDDDGVCLVEGSLEGATEGEPLDDYFDTDDFSDEARREAEEELDNFFDYLEENDLLESAREWADDGHIAHDFWLTRNGHGAGFWDGDYGDELGDKLTEAAKSFGSSSVYVGDDDKLHFGG